MTVIKIIVAVLALANAGYFLWVHGIAGSQDALPVAAPVATLKLVSEDPEGARRAAAEAASSAGTPAGGAAEAGDAGADPSNNLKRCISVGPFRDVAETAHAASTLRSGGYDPRQRVAEGEVWAGVWVYLPVPSGANAGERLLAKLKAAGIDDALEMPGPGGDAPVISLGLFSEQKRAQARVAQARALGLDPGVADRRRTGNVYWIDVDLKPSDGVLNPSDLQGEAGHISRLEIKACPAGQS